MRQLTINVFKEAGEPLEIHWLAGLERAADGSWLVRVVTHGLQSHEVRMWQLPIGMYPLLSLGTRFDNGVLLESQPRGEIQTVALSNLTAGIEVTSADIPNSLYSFFGRPSGAQKLVRYTVDTDEVLVPTMELVRFLLVHNKTLANALMVPGQLMTLYHFEPVGVHQELTLRFTSDMPERAISRSFALEFAWLAIHPDGRRVWDSVYRKSIGKKYVSLDLPDVPNAKMAFRGIRWKRSWLVLEILHLSGREPPCENLRYGHPGFQKARSSRTQEPRPGHTKPSRAKGGSDVEILVPEDGTRSAVSQPALDIRAKSPEFTIEVPIEKIWSSSAKERQHYRKSAAPTKGGIVDEDGATTKRRALIKGAANRERKGACIQPLEFQTLEAYPWAFAGELQALADTISIMADLIANTEISMALCRLKPGRAFSAVGHRPRCCLVVHINVTSQPPLVLIDVDRGGEWALSTMALSFQAPATFADIEMHVKTTLDRLVDHGGHWDPSLAAELHTVCHCRRLPKVLPKRSSHEKHQYRAIWAWRLAMKLGLPLKLGSQTNAE